MLRAIMVLGMMLLAACTGSSESDKAAAISKQTGTVLDESQILDSRWEDDQPAAGLSQPPPSLHSR